MKWVYVPLQIYFNLFSSWEIISCFLYRYVSQQQVVLLYCTIFANYFVLAKLTVGIDINDKFKKSNDLVWRLWAGRKQKAWL